MQETPETLIEETSALFSFVGWEDKSPLVGKIAIGV